MKDNNGVQTKVEKISNNKKIYKELELNLEKLRKRKPKYIFLIGAISSLTFLCSSIWIITHTLYYMVTYLEIIFFIILGSVFTIFFVFISFIMFDKKESKIEAELINYEIKNMQEEVQEDIFENSIKMSYKYLDQYYLQTKEQAKKGFSITACVSVFGAILIGIGIIAMFLEKTNPSYITCASGVITEFIAAIFFYLYNKTITSMSNYHNKLVLSQNISIALKVADSLPDQDKVKAKDSIVSELLKDINSYLIQSDVDNSK